jgi:hypothetical protein
LPIVLSCDLEDLRWAPSRPCTYHSSPHLKKKRNNKQNVLISSSFNQHFSASITMGIEKLVVTLDNPVFQPGQVLSGHISFTIKKAIVSDGVFIKISGKGETHWKERRYINNRNRSGHVGHGGRGKVLHYSLEAQCILYYWN